MIEVIYSFSWYKKRGSQALKTITGDSIASLSLLSSPRSIVYTPGFYHFILKIMIIIVMIEIIFI